VAVLIIIACILLTLVVLVQNSKGGGLAANFAAGNQAFGVRQTADFLEKATWTLAISVLVLCLAGTALLSRGGSDDASTIQKQLENVQSTPGQPEFPAMPQPNPTSTTEE
ncbi:MAG: preprotein translocase subunit SecG, partial [Prevotellaceae bacterium]|nr:preprotein translocase subunit SecG [Prevotellaceae bacterium]